MMHMYDVRFYESSYLKHHGILGQKWGLRRFQNEDGSLTDAGRKRYDDDNKDYDTSERYESSYTVRKNILNDDEKRENFIKKTEEITQFLNKQEEYLNSKLSKTKKFSVKIKKKIENAKDWVKESPIIKAASSAKKQVKSLGVNDPIFKKIKGSFKKD